MPSLAFSFSHSLQRRRPRADSIRDPWDSGGSTLPDAPQPSAQSPAQNFTSSAQPNGLFSAPTGAQIRAGRLSPARRSTGSLLGQTGVFFHRGCPPHYADSWSLLRQLRTTLQYRPQVRQRFRSFRRKVGRSHAALSQRAGLLRWTSLPGPFTRIHVITGSPTAASSVAASFPQPGSDSPWGRRRRINSIIPELRAAQSPLPWSLTYYPEPSVTARVVSLTFLTSIATDAGGNLVLEFFPYGGAQVPHHVQTPRHRVSSAQPFALKDRFGGRRRSPICDHLYLLLHL